MTVDESARRDLLIRGGHEVASDIKNIFISHVHEDDAELPKFKDLLSNHGHEIRDSSIDSSKPNDANNEDYIKSQMLAPRIQWAGCVIVLISPDTHTSKWVDWEIEYATRLDKRIVGVFVRGATDSHVPKNLELYADAVVGWNGPSVLDAISGKINDWTTATGNVRPVRAIPRFKC
jgi:hypothetical protein